MATNPIQIRRCAMLAMAALSAVAAWAQAPAPPVSPAPVLNLEYDAQGNPRRSIQAPAVPGFNFTTTQAYDRLHRRREVIDARAGVISLDYNGRDDLTQVTDPRNLTTRTPRDGLGNTTQVASPDTGTATHTFDAAGNLKTRLDSRGVQATYTYDALNRLTGESYPGDWGADEVVTWAYDQTGAGFSNGVGRLTSSSYAGGNTWGGNTAKYLYDAQGRLISTTQTNLETGHAASFTTAYGYDAAGHLTSITYPSGRVLTVAHLYGQPRSIWLASNAGSASTTLVSLLQFDRLPGQAGVLRSWRWHLNSGMQSHIREFDTSGRMVRHPLGGALRDISYDAADRIVSYTHLEPSGATTAATTALNQYFGYDQLGRLTSVGTSVGAFTYAYDAGGNRTQSSLNGVARSNIIAPGSNQLTSLDNPVRNRWHDPQGTTWMESEGNRFLSLYPNMRGSLIEFSLVQTTAVDGGRGDTSYQYTYNAFRQRVTKMELRTSRCNQSCVALPRSTDWAIAYVYDQQGQLLGEYNAATGAVIREYVWFQDIPMAVLDGPQASPSIYFIHTDHLNTPRVAVDRNGLQRWSWVAEPFGNSSPTTNLLGLGEVTLNLRMPGQYFDSETGLSYNYFRYYDAGVGRYTQSDPIGLAGGINTYTYVEGNPVSLTDPLGLTTYMCTKPLHALGDKWGPRLYPESRLNPSPLYHQFVCVPDGKGGMSCGGQDRAEGPFGPGKPSTDTYKPESCKPVDEKQCVEQCLLTEINNPNRPAYALFGGGGRNAGAMNCQQWADKKVEQCQQQCKAK